MAITGDFNCEYRFYTTFMPCITANNVVFTRRYRLPDGPGLCPVSGCVLCPAFVHCMSGVCPTDVRRTVKVDATPDIPHIRRTEGVAIIARDLMTYIVMT